MNENRIDQIDEEILDHIEADIMGAKKRRWICLIIPGIQTLCWNMFLIIMKKQFVTEM